MLHRLKPLVERYPALAATYRQAREQWHLWRMRPRRTPHGFVLLGDDTMFDGRFEPEETRLAKELLPSSDVFVDVGANVGYYACLAASMGVHAVAVEPMASNLACLYKSLEHNGFDAVEVVPMGVADAPGLRRLYGGATGASLVPGWSNTTEAFSRTISVTTLDNVLRGRFEGQRMLVKMDIEGAEWAALRGATETLARSPAPAWLVEVCLTENLPAGQQNPHFADVFALFREHGYACHTVDAARRPVEADDVARWVAQGRRDFGTYSFLFTRATH